MTKQPKFFCESCGFEVKQNAKVCPHCGKFFASVKCPSCGFVGDSRLFKDGCPACGYAINGSASPAHASGERHKKKTESDPLPWWMYVVTLAMLAVVIALIALRR